MSDATAEVRKLLNEIAASVTIVTLISKAEIAR
jgi:hypothetical protein